MENREDRYALPYMTTCRQTAFSSPDSVLVLVNGNEVRRIQRRKNDGLAKDQQSQQILHSQFSILNSREPRERRPNRAVISRRVSSWQGPLWSAAWLEPRRLRHRSAAGCPGQTARGIFAADRRRWPRRFGPSRHRRTGASLWPPRTAVR